VKPAQKIGLSILVLLSLSCMLASWIAPYPYARQFRELPNSTPTAAHLLGTDELGRDLFSRVAYGSRISLLLAPAAALLATVIAAFLGCSSGLLGGWWERFVFAVTDLSLAIPWLFLLITVRAQLPLSLPPLPSAFLTFILLGLLGWPVSVRVIATTVREMRNSDFLLLARASGCRPYRLLLRHTVPNLSPILTAQFLVTVALFILAEANLSILGLGVMEPMPSLGNLLKGLQDFESVSANPWRLAPLVVLVAVLFSFQLILPTEESLR
jgi:peptide/nickel transport system permease protein